MGFSGPFARYLRSTTRRIALMDAFALKIWQMSRSANPPCRASQDMCAGSVQRERLTMASIPLYYSFHKLGYPASRCPFSAKRRVSSHGKARVSANVKGCVRHAAESMQ